MAAIPKYPAIISVRAARDRITGFWIPLHDAFTGLGCQAPSEVIGAGSAHASKWSSQSMMYTFPTDNGATNQVSLLALHGENNLLDETLSLSTAEADGTTQILIAMRLRFGNQADTVGWIMCYGKNDSTSSVIGLTLSTGEALQAQLRGVGSGSVDTLTLTNTAGTAFTDAAWRDTNISLVYSLRRTGALTVGIEVQASNGTLSATYTGSHAVTDSTVMPGRNDASEEDHPGLMLGCRNSATPALYFGKGSGNTSSIGNVCGWRGSYAAGNAAAALASMLLYPHEYVRWMLED